MVILHCDIDFNGAKSTFFWLQVDCSNWHPENRPCLADTFREFFFQLFLKKNDRFSTPPRIGPGLYVRRADSTRSGQTLAVTRRTPGRDQRSGPGPRQGRVGTGST